MWPDNWLDWLTLVGSVAGILAAIKIFVYDKWLNLMQCRFIVATYMNEYKSIFASQVLGSGWIFHIPNDKRSQGYYNFFMSGGPDQIASYQNLIYLKELVRKGYFVYAREKSGIKDMYQDTYYLTAKGLRYGRLLQYTIKEPHIKKKRPSV